MPRLNWNYGVTIIIFHTFHTGTKPTKTSSNNTENVFNFCSLLIVVNVCTTYYVPNILDASSVPPTEHLAIYVHGLVGEGYINTTIRLLVVLSLRLLLHRNFLLLWLLCLIPHLKNIRHAAVKHVFIFITIWHRACLDEALLYRDSSLVPSSAPPLYLLSPPPPPPSLSSWDTVLVSVYHCRRTTSSIKHSKGTSGREREREREDKRADMHMSISQGVPKVCNAFLCCAWPKVGTACAGHEHRTM